MIIQPYQILELIHTHTQIDTFINNFSISSPLNDQVLIFSTYNSLNKWTPYTIIGATFNDTNKTITISGGSGSSALSGLTTDVTISTPTSNQLLQYNGTKWVNSDMTLYTLPVKSQASVTQNSTTTTTCIDGIDSYIVYGVTATFINPQPITPSAVLSSSTNGVKWFSSGCCI